MFSILLVGCGDISGGLKKCLTGPSCTGLSTNDFQKTEIIANGPGIADGVSQLLVVVHLKNSDNSTVAGYRPEYEIISGQGAIPNECTQSSKDGVSACVLQATEPGVKRLRLTNALVGLTKEITFDPSRRGGQLIGLVSASTRLTTTPAGHRAELSVGDWTRGPKLKTNTGYSGVITFQGAAGTR